MDSSTVIEILGRQWFELTTKERRAYYDIAEQLKSKYHRLGKKKSCVSSGPRQPSSTGSADLDELPNRSHRSRRLAQSPCSPQRLHDGDWGGDGLVICDSSTGEDDLYVKRKINDSSPQSDN